MIEKPAVILLKIIETANLKSIPVNERYLEERLSKMREDDSLILYDFPSGETHPADDISPRSQLKGGISALKTFGYLVEDKDSFLYVHPLGVEFLTQRQLNDNEKSIIEKYIK